MTFRHQGHQVPRSGHLVQPGMAGSDGDVPVYDTVRLRPRAARLAYDGAPAGVRNGAAVAQKVQTLFIDDLDGSAAEGTVRFGLYGTEYEIDLNAGACPAAEGRAGRLCEGWAAGQRRVSSARPRRAPGLGKRLEHHRGPGVGQGPGHQGERSRAGAR